MGLKNEINFSYNNIEEAEFKTRKFFRSMEIIKGKIEITVHRDDKEGGDIVEKQLRKKSVAEKLNILDKITEKGRELKKETIDEAFRIAEREEQDWGSSIE